MTNQEINQAKCWLKVCVEHGQLPMPVNVAIARGSSAEENAWWNAAIDYLKARKSGVTFREIQRRFKEALDDEG